MCIHISAYSVGIVSPHEMHGLCEYSHVMCTFALCKLLTVVFSSSQSSGWTALFFAVKEGYLEIVRKLIAAGTDVLIRDKVYT